jgi:hypothetical protein
MTTMTPELLAARLGKAIPKQLKCVVLYGSAAAGDFVPGASNFNLLILVDPLTTAELDAMAPTIAAWSHTGHPTPLLFTPNELTTSLDVFAIEMLDIQQSRRILWGEDLLADVRVRPEHLRSQIERELTGKLLSLRGRYLLIKHDSQSTLDLMSRALSTFLVLFRAALRLYQDHVPATKLDALHALRKHVDFDVEPFRQLFEMKQSATDAPPGSQVSFDAYLRAIEAVISAVNHYTPSQRSNT